ncbi:MAG TPA: glycosyltransferase family 1 protein [Gammaproteobacteria bacterium]|nr:glycosyltransferase family 1 protein [Gammaproteobacteria bacterium]
MNASKNIWVVYPFTACTLGVADEYFVKSNTSNAFFVALRQARRILGVDACAVCLTDAVAGYTISDKGVSFRFFPVSGKRGADARAFGKQWSRYLVTNLIRERPALVFLFIGYGWFAILLAAICQLLSIPYVPIIAGWGVSTRRSLRWYYGNALRTIVHTETHKKRFAEAGVDVGNFLVMPMGVDTDLFQAKPLSAYRKSPDQVRFIHVGRIVARKNLLLALRTFAAIRKMSPGAHFDVVGPVGEREYYTRVTQYVKQRGLESAVTFHGEVPNDRLPTFYQKADLMLFPTLSESFGFVIAESMACGTPVAALSGKGSPDELIQDGTDGILTSQERYTARVLSILHRPDELMKMGQAARGKVVEKYSSRRTYQQLQDLITIL